LLLPNHYFLLIENEVSFAWVEEEVRLQIERKNSERIQQTKTEISWRKAAFI
jgi:hypothetical protein